MFDLGALVTDVFKGQKRAFVTNIHDEWYAFQRGGFGRLGVDALFHQYNSFPWQWFHGCDAGLVSDTKMPVDYCANQSFAK